MCVHIYIYIYIFIYLSICIFVYTHAYHTHTRSMYTRGRPAGRRAGVLGISLFTPSPPTKNFDLRTQRDSNHIETHRVPIFCAVPLPEAPLVRPVRLLRVSISEGLTQANS